MRLGEQRLALGHEAVVDARHARIVVRPAGRDPRDRFAGRGRGPHDAEGALRRVRLEVEEPEEEVLVEIAAHQPLLQRVAVQERFPSLYLLRHVRGEGRRTLIGRAGREPARDRAELALVETRQAVGHPGQGEPALVGLVLVDARAVLRAVDREIERARQHGIAGERVGALLGEAAVEHARSEVGSGSRCALVQNGEEALPAPLGSLVRIDEEPRRRRLAETAAVVNGRGAAATRNPLPRAELDLAGRVIAAVAHDAAALEDGLHVGAVGHPAGGRGRCVVAGGIGRAVALVDG